MKIAISSNNGKEVDTHFGKSSLLYIYDYDEDEDKWEFIENRSVGIDKESKHQNKIIIKSLEDCDVAISLQHGGRADLYAKEVGLKLVDDEGSIEEVLENYINHIKFMKNIKI